MRAGFIHDEFCYSRTLTKAYPYTHPKAFFANTRTIHGTIHHMPLALKCDKLPFNTTFDYSPYDLLILYLQGGRCKEDVDTIKFIKEKYPDILVVWWWGEIYRFDHNPILWFEHILHSEREILKAVDVFTSPFHAYGELKKFTKLWKKFDVPFRLLVEPYDTEDLKINHSKIGRNFDNGIWTMVHGRNIDLSRSLTVMGRLQKKIPELKCYVHMWGTTVNQHVINLRNKVAPNLKFEFTSNIRPHNAFLDKLKTYMFIFDDYFAYCGSNLNLCAAGIGMPTISHQFNTSSTLCFPKLTCPLDDLDKWCEVAESLIYRNDFYYTVMREAQENIEKYYSYKAVNKMVKNIYRDFR